MLLRTVDFSAKPRLFLMKTCDCMQKLILCNKGIRYWADAFLGHSFNRSLTGYISGQEVIALLN